VCMMRVFISLYTHHESYIYTFLKIFGNHCW
jgi:hypothetical protein